MANKVAMANVIDAARRHGVRRVVFCSSWSAYGRQPDGTIVSESTSSLAKQPINPRFGFIIGGPSSAVPYFECKHDLEGQLRSAAAAGEGNPEGEERAAGSTPFEAVILQPCSVFGRFGDTGWCEIFGRLQKSNGNMPGLPGGSSFVDVQDIFAANEKRC